MELNDFSNNHLLLDLILDDSGDLMISPSGDLSITSDGRKCLLQDIKHYIETIPGDLFSHPEYGSGIKRLLGDSQTTQELLIKSISTALLYNPVILSRINPTKIIFKINKNSQSELTIEFEIEGIKEKMKL